MKSKKKNKVIVGLGVGLLSITVLTVSLLSFSRDSDTKDEPKVISEKKEESTNIKEHSQPQSSTLRVKEVVKDEVNNKKEKNQDTNKIEIDNEQKLIQDTSKPSEKAEDIPNISNETEQIPNIVEEKEESVLYEEVVPSRNIISATAFVTTQYSHTTATHIEGETYSVPATPVTILGNSISGTVTRTGIGTEKGSIILNYILNFDSQGRYLSGEVTSSGYVTAQINLSVGEIYTDSISDVITTSYGRALSGSLVYPVCVSLNLRV